MPKTVLIVIDVQNDYFPAGNFPLWDVEACLARIEQAIAKAAAQGMPVVLIQHVADPAKGKAPFFNAGTPGVEIHPRILAAAPGAPVVTKAFADAFHQTTLGETLASLQVDKLLICGMMTQNCVTHTAISPGAAPFQAMILGDCCTTVSDILHRIALNGVSTRVPILTADTAL